MHSGMLYTGVFCTFVKSFQGYYKDGTNEIPDFRMISSTFLILSSIVGITVTVIPHYNVPPQHNISHIVCDNINTAIRDSLHGC